MDKNTNRMGNMPIGKLLMKMSGPAIFSMLVNALYNIVDSIFVAQLGEKALTAVTIGFPVQYLIVAMGVGTGVGINSLIARRLGAQRKKEADDAATSGIKLAFFNSLGLLIFGLFFSRMFVQLFSTDESIVSQGTVYLSIVTIFSIFAMTELLLEKIFQGTGNMIYPMIMMISGAVVNTIVDPILIFGLLGAPKLGVAGAAISTVFAQLVSMSIGIYFIKNKNIVIKVSIFRGKINWGTIKEIYAVGIPSILMQGLGSVMIFVLNMILAAYSTTAVAVLGIYGRLQMFIFMPATGVNQGALPIMGYNYGAGNRSRMMETFKKANFVTLIIMIFGMAMFHIYTDELLSIFNASDEMYEIGRVALKVVSICFIPAGFGIISAGLLQATGHGMLSMWGSVIRQLAGISPLAYIFGKIGGVTMIWAAFPIAEAIGFIYYATIIYRLNRSTFIKLEEHEYEK